MARLPRRISSSLSVLFFISYLGLSNLAFAQLTPQECAIGVYNEFYPMYKTITSSPTVNMMSFCPLWAGVCSYVHIYCPTAATCIFTNCDPGITAQYDPNYPTSWTDFLSCTSCNVEVSVDPNALLPSNIRVLVPTQNKCSGNIDQILLPGESEDMLAEKSSTISITSAATTILVVGSIVGSLVAVKTSSTGAGFLAGAGAGAGLIAPISNPQTGSGNGQSAIDAVTLLLHFQSISTSGLLSISYPALYRFFSYNFAWANLIIASDAFKDAAGNFGTNPSCLRNLGVIGPGLTDDPFYLTGMTVMGKRYDLDRATLGGLVYLSAIIGVASALAVFVLVTLVLRILNAISKSGKLQVQIEIWPSRASSMSLRLFIWVLGSVSTFAFYQFAEPCSSTSLLAFASVELVLIILTLLTVSILIVKIAKAHGPEALFPLSESDESKYFRKWGSLYATLKPALYWVFIPDYIFILVKSVIVGVGQGSGIAQVCVLTAVELATLLALLKKRPYGTPAGNVFHIFSACKRVFASAILIAFWNGFNVPTDTKRSIGVVLIVVESLYAGGLFVTLLYNNGAAIMRWNAERKERRRASANNEAISPPAVPPLHHTDSYCTISINSA